MNRPFVGLVLLAAFFGINFGWRTWRHLRATGSSGFRGISGRVGSVEWLGGALFGVAVLLVVGSPLVELVGWTRPLYSSTDWSDAAALLLMLGGMVGTGWSQATMGASWRIGVKADERTELVERGPFRWVRNPIFSSMLVSVGGLVLLLPNVVTVSAFASMFIAVELQVRFVEEPYLLRTHGDQYASYTARAGRFVPGLGKHLSSRTSAA